MNTKIFIISLTLNLVFTISLLFVIVKVGGVSYFFQKLANLGKNKAFSSRQMVFSELPSVNNKIVFIGNSITAGGEWAELFNRSDVVNRGIDGDIIPGVKDRIVPILEEKPKQVFIMIGINDLLRGASVSKVKEEYESLLLVCSQYPSTKIFVQSILPINNKVLYDKKLKNLEISAANTHIHQLVNKFGFSYLNLYNSFLSKDENNLKSELSTDGLHLSGKGYILWRDLIIDKIAH